MTPKEYIAEYWPETLAPAPKPPAKPAPKEDRSAASIADRIYPHLIPNRNRKESK